MKIKYFLYVLLGKISIPEAVQISKLGSYRLWFGKFKGSTLDKIWDKEHTYLDWFLKQKDTTCIKTQTRVSNYLKLRHKIGGDKNGT